jgi:hypothetical protein
VEEEMSDTSSISATGLFVFLAACLLQPHAGARAGTVTFNDLSDSTTDSITIADTTGRLTSSVCNTDEEHCFVTFSAPPNAVSFSSSLPTFPNQGVNIRESPAGRLSDVLLFSFDLSGGSLEFVSDTDGGPILDPIAGPFIDETGTSQTAVSVTWTLADGSTVVDSIAFVSDVEGQVVPEPGTLALFCTGLAGLVGIRRKL